MEPHTPGPWMVEPHSDTDEVVNVVSEYVVRPDGIKVANWIAELDAQIDFDSDIEAQLQRVNANAYLIAAAPDMLFCLQQILALVDTDQVSALAVAISATCRSAIAKAEGRS